MGRLVEEEELTKDSMHIWQILPELPHELAINLVLPCP